MKKCHRCKQMKPLDVITSNGYCRPCNIEYGRQYQAKNRERRNAQNRRCAAKRYKMNRDHMIAYLGEHPCVDCGEADIVVLDFDHTDPSKKRAQIADVLGSWNWQTILAEIDKCLVRCANCHRRRTSIQLGWYKGGVANDREPGNASVD